MRYLTSSLLAGALLAGALALGAAPQEAAAQSCSKPKKGCVKKKDIKKNAVDSSRVKNNSLTGSDVKDGTLTGGDFAASTLSGDDFAAGGLTGTDIEDGSIGATALAPNLDRDLMADLACDEDQIAQFLEGAWRCVTGGASYVFLSERAENGAFGESTWDGVCETEAMAAGLPAGTYEAWLSDTLTDARDMLPPGPFFLPPDPLTPNPGGNLLALSKADLLDSVIFRTLNIQADGTAVVAGANSVWTGTNADGTRHPDTCDGWADPGAVGGLGVRNATNSGWTASSRGGCGASFRVYCFQVQ